MRSTIILFVLALSLTSATAQNIDFEVSDPHPNFQGGLFGDLHFSDIDGDDDIDLFICGRTDGWVSVDASTLYLNDGEGNFTEDAEAGITAMESASAVFSDFDGDNDDDLLLCGLSNSSTFLAELYLNDGLGNFILVESSPFEPSSNGDIAVGDVNGDGHIDVYLMGIDAEGQAFNRLYVNGGAADFVEVNATPFLSVSNGAIELADMDGDSDLDLFCIGSNENDEAVSILHLNDGTGGFSSVPTGIDNFSSGDFALGDLDADGDLDVILSGAKSDGMAYTELYLNDGSAAYTLFPGSVVFPDLSLGANALADLDGDEDLDIVLVGTADGGLGSEVGIITNIFENLGGNTYILADSLTGAYIAGLALGDVDGDVDLDLLVTGTTVGTPTFKTWLFLNQSELSVGLLEQEENTLEVFPNPSDGTFNIRTDDHIGSNIEVYSQSGALVHSEILRNETQQLDLNLADGVYTLVLHSRDVFMKRVFTIMR